MRASGEFSGRKPFGHKPFGHKPFGLAILIPLICLILGACASKESIRKPVYKRGFSQAYVSSTGKRYHVVKRGETLFRIARRYRVSLSELKRLNRITDERDIKVGTKLRLPGRRSKRKASTPRQKPRVAVYTPKTSVKFIWPVKKIKISSRFGIRSSKKHDGVDLRADKGTPIYAAARGKVLLSGKGPSGYGNMIIIKHDRRTITIYAHNHRNLVRVGQIVKQGQKIATIGRTGKATGYHVHFEIRINRKPVNPEKYLKKRRR